MRLLTILLSALALLTAGGVSAQEAKPTLVVNIVVSQMRYDYLERFSKNFGPNGFNRFINLGTVYADARYNYMQTITPATLATLTTGADPSMHGIVSERWVDYTTTRVVSLIDDPAARGLDCDAGLGRYSPRNLTVPTLGDRLKEQYPESRVVTIATDPVSAVVMGGFHSDVYWMDSSRGNWISSTAYMDALPQWVMQYNSLRPASQYLDYQWNLLLGRSHYVNSVNSVFNFNDGRFRKLMSLDFLRGRNQRDYPSILYTPAANTLVGEFARQALANEQLGKRNTVDLLNICFDAPRHIGELYGGESMETEDMFYRLDQEIAGLMAYLETHIDMRRVVVVLTSDHGASDSFDYGREERERLNAAQFKVIMNGFMNAQYGSGDWIVEYSDRQLYFNRDLIYSRGMNLDQVQARVAAFALQFRGVSHVLTSTALQNSSFGGGYAEKMQNSFYPKRSGDVIINLMPGWIEEREGVRAAAGSMYEYDVHVPLMVLSPRLGGQTVQRTVNMRDLAPTLAHIMRVSRPIASEGEPLTEVTEKF